MSITEYESILQRIADIACKAKRTENHRCGPEYLEALADLIVTAADAYDREAK